MELLLRSKRAEGRPGGSTRRPFRKSRGELSFVGNFQLCAPRSPFQILEMCMCCSLIS